jgi:hypothetical protein
MTLAAVLTDRPVDLADAYNGSGSDIPAGRFVTGTEDAITLPAADTDPIYGVTQNVIKNGQRGAVITLGKAIVTAGVGGTTAGARVKPEAATGKAIVWGSAKSIGGIARSTVAADASVEVYLSGVGITAA